MEILTEQLEQLNRELADVYQQRKEKCLGRICQCKNDRASSQLQVDMAAADQGGRGADPTHPGPGGRYKRARTSPCVSKYVRA